MPHPSSGKRRPDSPEMLRRSRSFRHVPTQAEERLWSALRARRLAGHKFRRQQILGDYIVDFYCPALRLVIELDGPSHLNQVGYDQLRDGWMKRIGLQVLRFSNDEVLRDLDRVLERIVAACSSSSRPSPSNGEGES